MDEIIHAAKELGINYKIFTSSKTSEFYSDHQWSVIQNSQVGPVINAVPDIKIADTVPWEEWFFMDEEIHHHILFLKKHPKSSEVWEGSLDDKEHPKQVLGFTWHVFNEKDVTPYLNQLPTKIP